MDTLANLLHRAHGLGAGGVVHDDGVELSYAELDRRAGRVAHELRRRGVQAGERVGILSRNDPAFFSVWFGAMKCGAVLVPVNFRLGAAEVRDVLQHSRARVLFVGAGFEEMGAQAAAALPCIDHLVRLADGRAGHPQAYGCWTGRGPECHDGSSRGDDAAILIPTSGTTGRAKCAQLSHAALIADLRRYDTLGIWLERDVMLLAMPLVHLGGIGFGLRSIYRGARMVLLRDVDPLRVLQHIERERVTKVLLVPTMIRDLLDSPACEHTDLSSLDLITYGAAPMPPALLLRALNVFGCRFGTGYGLTESGGAVTFLGPEDHDPARPMRLHSCGRPSGAEVRVVDPLGSVLPPGEVGEILIRSPQLMSGYLDAPAETAHALRDGWLHSGDAGYFDPDGYLHVCDRIKDMIVSGGENIYPAEVEAVLATHCAVAEAAVIGVPDERWGEAPKALVVARPGMAVRPQELQAFLRGRIAAYKVPRSIELLDTLPRNASGKVLKRQLREAHGSANTQVK